MAGWAPTQEQIDRARRDGRLHKPATSETVLMIFDGDRWIAETFGHEAAREACRTLLAEGYGRLTVRNPDGQTVELAELRDGRVVFHTTSLSARRAA